MVQEAAVLILINILPPPFMAVDSLMHEIPVLAVSMAVPAAAAAFHTCPIVTVVVRRRISAPHRDIMILMAIVDRHRPIISILTIAVVQVVGRHRLQRNELRLATAQVMQHPLLPADPPTHPVAVPLDLRRPFEDGTLIPMDTILKADVVHHHHHLDTGEETLTTIIDTGVPTTVGNTVVAVLLLLLLLITVITLPTAVAEEMWALELLGDERRRLILRLHIDVVLLLRTVTRILMDTLEEVLPREEAIQQYPKTITKMIMA
jgi:hypothetical protein